MFERASHTHKSLAGLLAPVLILLVLAACSGEPKRAEDYRDAFPLTVSKETVSMTLKVPLPENGLTGQENLDFQRFVRDFHNRGRNALTIKAERGAEQVRDLFVKAGVRPREITVSKANIGSDAVFVSFNAHKVEVPECGDFTTKTTPNWTNRRHSNYGCATRRNLGLMVKDPGDLKKAQPMPGASGERMGNAVSGYKAPAAGAAAGAAAEGGATQ